MRLFIYLFIILISILALNGCQQSINTGDLNKPTMSPIITNTQMLVSPNAIVIISTAITLTAEMPLLAHYQGSNPYRKNPLFDLAYDPLIWSLVDDQGTNLGTRLINNTIANCYLRLEAGPLGAPFIASTSLAGREWTILQIQPKILQYFFTMDDISFIIDLVLPKEYSLMSKSDCQLQAEEIINTFQVIQ